MGCMSHNVPSPAAAEKRPLGLPVLALIGLALLAVPRPILEDLELIRPGGALSVLLIVVTVAIWITAALVAKVPRPFLTVLVIGAISGGMLVITYQLLWGSLFEAEPDIAGSSVPVLVLRLAAIPGGLVVGTLMGAVGGLIAWGIRALMRTSSKRGTR